MKALSLTSVIFMGLTLISPSHAQDEPVFSNSASQAFYDNLMLGERIRRSREKADLELEQQRLEVERRRAELEQLRGQAAAPTSTAERLNRDVLVADPVSGPGRESPC